MKIAGVILACAFASTIARADPSPEVRRLMNDPVSMLDWGLAELGRTTQEALHSRIQELQFPPGQLYVGAAYDWAKNEIQVTVTSSLIRRPQPKQDCRHSVDWIRENLAPRALNKDPNNPVILWADLFKHSGYTNSGKADADLGKHLSKLVVVYAFVFPATTGKLVKCSGPLLSESIGFEE